MPDFEKLILNRDVKRLVQLLGSRRQDYRLQAIRGLGAARAWREIPLLAERLRDDAPEIRLAAVEALAAIRRREGVDALIAALPDGHQDVANASWRALVAMGGAERIPLAESLRAFADHVPLLLRILDHLEPESILDALLGLLEHPDERVVERARARIATLGEAADDALASVFVGGTAKQAHEIAEIWKPRALALLDRVVALLERVPDEPERKTALLYVLAESRDERTAPVFRGLLRDSSRQVRITALALLTRFRNQAIEAFKHLLREPDFPDRSRLIAYVKQRWRLWGDALVDLLSASDYSDWRVRELAKVTLGGRGDLLPRIVQRYLERGDLAVDDVADLLLFDPAVAMDNVLAQLRLQAEGGTDGGQRLWALLVECVNRLGVQAVAPLEKAATAPDCGSPSTAVRLLATLGDPAAPSIVRLLEFRAPGREGLGPLVRGCARDAVRVVGIPCGPLLVRAMQLPGSTKEVEEALVSLGDDALAPLVGALLDAYEHGRDWKTWCRLLTAMRGADPGPVLPLANHPSNEVRRAAFRALRGRGGPAVEEAMGRIINAALGKRPVEPRVLWALEVLEVLESDGARRIVQRLVTHPDQRVKRRALEYIRRTARSRARRVTAPKLKTIRREDGNRIETIRPETSGSDGTNEPDGTDAAS